MATVVWWMEKDKLGVKVGMWKKEDTEGVSRVSWLGMWCRLGFEQS